MSLWVMPLLLAAECIPNCSMPQLQRQLLFSSCWLLITGMWAHCCHLPLSRNLDFLTMWNHSLLKYWQLYQISKTLCMPNKTHLQARSESYNSAVLEHYARQVCKLSLKLTTPFSGWSYRKPTKGSPKNNYYVNTKSCRYKKPDLPS